MRRGNGVMRGATARRRPVYCLSTAAEQAAAMPINVATPTQYRPPSGWEPRPRPSHPSYSTPARTLKNTRDPP
eukprot:362118-Chlamydomonas_euryale.AAC.2